MKGRSMNNNGIDLVDEKDRYVTISALMEKYSMGRATMIRWVRENEGVRYFKEGTVLRVHLGDFEEMINKKVEKTLASDRGEKNGE